MSDFTAALETTAFATALRGSVWIYPLVNAAHILGVALLVGAIVPLDLRLLGMWRTVPVGPLWRVLTRTAAVGLAVAVMAGALLFIARADDYVASSLFLSKMALVAAGAANALVLHGTDPAASSAAAPTAFMRVAACVSLCLWPAALVLGRLVGYF